MRKRAVLALMLVFALTVTTGCSLIIKDDEVDKQTPIIEVAGKTIVKQEVAEMVEDVLDYQEYMYYMYGLSFDRTSATAVASAQDNAIDTLIQQAVLDQKVAELEMDQFTEEETADLEQTADTNWTSAFDSVQNAYFADTELTGDELTKAVEEKMAELGYQSKDDMLTVAKQTKAYDKLKADVVKDVAVTEEELAAEYQTRVDDAKASYESNPASYGTAAQNGSTVYYVPGGYRYVKHILLQFADENKTKIDELESQLSAKNSELSTAQSSLTALGEDASADDEDTAKNRETLTATVETLTAEIADLQAQADAAREEAYAALQPTVDEILAKVAEGADFDELIATYGQDPGMSSGANDEGYLVCAESTNWVTEFTEGSMALENVGDVSGAVRSSYGIHIIKYVGDAVEGEVGLDAVRDTLEGELLSSKQDELYNATVEQWVEAANAKVYKDRLN